MAHGQRNSGSCGNLSSRSGASDGNIPNMVESTGQPEPTMGLLSAILMIVGTLIGTGIFASPGPLFDSVNSAGTSILIWTVAGVICTIGAYAYAELGAMYSESGGDYQYLKRSFGSKMSLTFGWTYITLLNPLGTAGTAGVFGRYCADLVTYYHYEKAVLARQAREVATVATSMATAAAVSVATGGMVVGNKNSTLPSSDDPDLGLPSLSATLSPLGSSSLSSSPSSPSTSLPSGSLSISPSSVAATASATAAELALYDISPPTRWTVTLFAISGVVLIGLINLCFQEGGKITSNVLTIVKVLGMGMLIVLGMVRAAATHGQSDAFQIPIQESSHNVLDYVSALCFAFFAFNGFNNINLGLGELKNPERNLKYAVCVALPFVTVLFILANLAFFAILSNHDLRFGASMTLQAGHVVLGYSGGCIMAVIVMASALGSINANIWAGSRLLVTLAKDDQVFPNLIAKEWKTPLWDPRIWKSCWKHKFGDCGSNQDESSRSRDLGMHRTDTAATVAADWTETRTQEGGEKGKDRSERVNLEQSDRQHQSDNSIGENEKVRIQDDRIEISERDQQRASLEKNPHRRSSFSSTCSSSTFQSSTTMQDSKAMAAPSTSATRLDVCQEGYRSIHDSLGQEEQGIMATSSEQSFASATPAISHRGTTNARAIGLLVLQASLHILINLDFKMFSRIYSAIGWAWYGIGISGLLYLRKSQPDLKRPVKIWTPLAVLFVIVATFLVVGALVLAFVNRSPQSMGIFAYSIIVTACVAPAYWARQWCRRAEYEHWPVWRMLLKLTNRKPREDTRDDSTDPSMSTAQSLRSFTPITSVYQSDGPILEFGQESENPNSMLIARSQSSTSMLTLVHKQSRAGTGKSLLESSTASSSRAPSRTYTKHLLAPPLEIDSNITFLQQPLQDSPYPLQPSSFLFQQEELTTSPKSMMDLQNDNDKGANDCTSERFLTSPTTVAPVAAAFDQLMVDRIWRPTATIPSRRGSATGSTSVLAADSRTIAGESENLESARNTIEVVFHGP